MTRQEIDYEQSNAFRLDFLHLLPSVWTTINSEGQKRFGAGDEGGGVEGGGWRWGEG